MQCAQDIPGFRELLVKLTCDDLFQRACAIWLADACAERTTQEKQYWLAMYHLLYLSDLTFTDPVQFLRGWNLDETKFNTKDGLHATFPAPDPSRPWSLHVRDQPSVTYTETGKATNYCELAIELVYASMVQIDEPTPCLVADVLPSYKSFCNDPTVPMNAILMEMVQGYTLGRGGLLVMREPQYGLVSLPLTQTVRNDVCAFALEQCSFATKTVQVVYESPEVDQYRRSLFNDETWEDNVGYRLAVHLSTVCKPCFFLCNICRLPEEHGHNKFRMDLVCMPLQKDIHVFLENLPQEERPMYIPDHSAVRTQVLPKCVRSFVFLDTTSRRDKDDWESLVPGLVTPLLPSQAELLHCADMSLSTNILQCFSGAVQCSYAESKSEKETKCLFFTKEPSVTVSPSSFDGARWKQLVRMRTAVLFTPSTSGRKLLLLCLGLLHGSCSLLFVPNNSLIAYKREITKHFLTSLYMTRTICFAMRAKDFAHPAGLYIVGYDSARSVMKGCPPDMIDCVLFDTPLVGDVPMLTSFGPRRTCATTIIAAASHVFAANINMAYYLDVIAPLTRIKLFPNPNRNDTFVRNHITVAVPYYNDPKTVTFHYIPQTSTETFERQDLFGIFDEWRTNDGTDGKKRLTATLHTLSCMDANSLSIAETKCSLDLLMRQADAHITRNQFTIVNSSVVCQIEDPHDLCCCVCMSVFADPVQLPCAHIICLFCISNIVSTCQPLCPTCRTPLGPRRPYAVTRVTVTNKDQSKHPREEEAKKAVCTVLQGSKYEYLNNQVVCQQRTSLVISCMAQRITTDMKNADGQIPFLVTFREAMSQDFRPFKDIVVAHFRFSRDEFLLQTVFARAAALQQNVHLICYKNGADEFILRHLLQHQRPDVAANDMRLRLFLLQDAKATRLCTIAKMVRCLVRWTYVESYLFSRQAPRLIASSILIPPKPACLPVDVHPIIMFQNCVFQRRQMRLDLHASDHLDWSLYLQSEEMIYFDGHTSCPREFPPFEGSGVPVLWKTFWQNPYLVLMSRSRWPHDKTWDDHFDYVFGDFVIPTRSQ